MTIQKTKGKIKKHKKRNIFTVYLCMCERKNEREREREREREKERERERKRERASASASQTEWLFNLSRKNGKRDYSSTYGQASAMVEQKLDDAFMPRKHGKCQWCLAKLHTRIGAEKDSFGEQEKEQDEISFFFFF